jgi:DNA-binding PadR family transcriptional regulator
MSAHATARLRDLLAGPQPSQEFNPGVVNRLQRSGYVEIVHLPSPYRTRRGNIAYLRITDAGREFLAQTHTKGATMLTPAEQDQIRASVREKWRQRLIEEEQKNDLDPIALGMRVAKALDDYAEEIDQDVAAEIEATDARRGA